MSMIASIASRKEVFQRPGEGCCVYIIRYHPLRHHPIMLVPKKECRSNKNYWVVSLGKKMTGSKRQRRYFNSRKEARAFIEAAEVSRKKMNCRPRTLTQYESYFRVINADLGVLCLAKLEPSAIEDWIEKSGWKPRTKKNYLVTLTTILNYALSKGYIKTSQRYLKFCGLRLGSRNGI